MTKNSTLPPSPRPMPTTGRPDRNEPYRNDLYPGMKAGMFTDRPMPVNPGRAPEGED